VVKIEIEKIGSIENRVIEEPAATEFAMTREGEGSAGAP